MAQSLSHTWGQIIGNAVEKGISPILRDVANEFGLFLDSAGPRPARSGKKLTWVDSHGNTHDLDYVLERGGTQQVRGTPAGFIEVAWRRYTRHSKNKAQEIQGAILPLAETYRLDAPFLGAVIAGDFTDNALLQLQSVGFHILYIPYADVLAAFKTVGIDASYDDKTPEEVFRRTIEKWRGLTAVEQSAVSTRLVVKSSERVERFIAALRGTIGRSIKRVAVIPLFGHTLEFSHLKAALDYLDRGTPDQQPFDVFVRMEIEVVFTNGDNVRGSFSTPNAANSFLRSIGR